MYSIKMTLFFQSFVLIFYFCESHSKPADTVKGYFDQLSDNLKNVDKKYLPQAYSKLTLTTGVKTTTTTTTTTQATLPYRSEEELCHVSVEPTDILIVTRVCQSVNSQFVQAVILDNKSVMLTYHTNISNVSYLNKFKGLFKGQAFLKQKKMHLDIKIDPYSLGLADPPVNDQDLFFITVLRPQPYGPMRVVSQMADSISLKTDYSYNL